MATNTTSNKASTKTSKNSTSSKGGTSRGADDGTRAERNRSRAADPMRLLKTDHREVEQLLDRLSDSDEGAQRRSMVQELVSKLTLHMQIEEELLYPLVASEVGSEDEEEAEIEHGLAREGLSKLESMVDAPGFGAAVEMLKGGIKHHVEEEEKEILPELRTAMEREEWQDLGQQILLAKEAAGAPASADTRRRSSKRTGSRASSRP